ncbi:MAG: methyl-accepting chemotaxis protein, partial [Planctomycetes bacterium]|nr:methyl-accepting chemotaxis protein [Planctomycetota bacterium]
MKLSIAIKTGLISMFITGAGIIGISYISFKEAGNLLQEQSLVNLSEGVRKESDALRNTYKTMTEDVLFLSENPPVKGIIRAFQTDGYDIKENTTLKAWKKRLETTFTTLLKNRSYYNQIRFIGKRDSGMELVRAERKGSEVFVVENSNLQEKGEAEYFKDIVSLRKKQVYFSKINLNRENYRIQVPYQLVIRVGVPVYDQVNNEVFGVVVINADFNAQVFSLSESQENVYYFVANGSGEYIVHPDETKRYAFEFGRSARYQDDYPIEKENETLLDRVGHEVVCYISDDVGISLCRISFDPINPNRTLTLGAVAENSFILATTRNLQRRLIIITLVIAGVISIITSLVMRKLMRPIVRLKQVADRISSGEEHVEVPTLGRDEIGEMAISMSTMLEKLSLSRSNLIQLSSTLDSKVKERTEDLANANLELESEISERMRIDEARSLAEVALQMETKLVRLMQEVAVETGEASSVEIAMQVCLDKVCVYSGFSVGHAYLPDSKGVLIPSNIWHFDQPDKYEKFRRVT